MKCSACENDQHHACNLATSCDCECDGCGDGPDFSLEYPKLAPPAPDPSAPSDQSDPSQVEF